MTPHEPVYRLITQTKSPQRREAITMSFKCSSSLRKVLIISRISRKALGCVVSHQLFRLPVQACVPKPLSLIRCAWTNGATYIPRGLQQFHDERASSLARYYQGQRRRDIYIFPSSSYSGPGAGLEGYIFRIQIRRSIPDLSDCYCWQTPNQHFRTSPDTDERLSSLKVMVSFHNGMAVSLIVPAPDSTSIGA